MINNDPVTISEVLVFKTNISSDQDIEVLARILGIEKKILRWNIDRQDIDNVLRIEGSNIPPGKIITQLSNAGFMCEELPD